MTIRSLATVLAALLLAAAHPSLAAAQEASADTGAVRVEGPTLVAFFPPVTQAQVDADDELATVLEDFSFHLSQATDPLRKGGVAVHVRFAERVRLEGEVAERDFAIADPDGDVGYYLVAPGRPPRVFRGVMTDIDLLQAAEEYFGLRLLDPEQP